MKYSNYESVPDKVHICLTYPRSGEELDVGVQPRHLASSTTEVYLQFFADELKGRNREYP